MSTVKVSNQQKKKIQIQMTYQKSLVAVVIKHQLVKKQSKQITLQYRRILMMRLKMVVQMKVKHQYLKMLLKILLNQMFLVTAEVLKDLIHLTKQLQLLKKHLKKHKKSQLMMMLKSGYTQIYLRFTQKIQLYLTKRLLKILDTTSQVMLILIKKSKNVTTSNQNSTLVSSMSSRSHQPRQLTILLSSLK